uniref:Bisphosphoglycerate mutase-like n=1 Tax=Castor canadensis TaxID=51338 RepID=A0A8B7UVI0_CASCN|nr:bisphosphoglycerate mutase-like [Castor canadensis]
MVEKSRYKLDICSECVCSCQHQFVVPILNPGGISDEDIINITLPTGVPILLELDENLQAVGPHQFLGDQEAIQAAIKKVEDQGKVKKNKK